ncbi:MAG: polymer-forming cytoskeletal protein [Henriciella sp.]|nr:polymer-forming cytoskeletal protein [Henriciella sp.]
MFTKTKSDTPSFSPAQDAVRGASTKPAARVGASILCSDVQIVGSIKSEGALQIDGTVEGDVSAGDVTIGSTGKIIGEIKAETLRVKGEIKGSVRAKKVELETGASVLGDIYHAALIIQPDAAFEGQVKRQEDPLKDAAPKAAAPSSGLTSSTTPMAASNPALGPSGNA